MFLMVGRRVGDGLQVRGVLRQGVIEGDKGSTALFFVGAALLVLAVWLVVEALFAFRRYQCLKTTATELHSREG